MDLLRLDAVGIVAKVRTVYRRSRVTLEFMIRMKGREGAQRERVIEERERDRERGNESKRLKERKVGKERDRDREVAYGDDEERGREE